MGSDVTKEASDITLTDDNFATILKAIGEGRRIYSVIGKSALHLLSSNVAEIIILILGLAPRDMVNDAIFPMVSYRANHFELILDSCPSVPFLVTSRELFLSHFFEFKLL